MVVVTENLPYEEIVKQLKDKEKVAIITCNTCVRAYGTGGVEVMDQLAEKLQNNGHEITDRVVLATACFEDYIQTSPIGNEWTTGIILACDSGYGVVKQHLKGKRIIRGLKTVGIQQGRKPAPLASLEE
ncbi:MAG: hypothetical protein ACXAEU_06165 [Candidatus Hodarchaeales archaeon]|jgi:hypothetical protein